MKIAILFLLVTVVTCTDNNMNNDNNYEGFESSDLQRRVSVEPLISSSSKRQQFSPTGGSRDSGNIHNSSGTGGSCSPGRISPIPQHRSHHQQTDSSSTGPIPFPGQSGQLFPPSSGTPRPPHPRHPDWIAGRGD